MVGRFRVTFVEMPGAGGQALPVVVADTETGTVSPVPCSPVCARFARRRSSAVCCVLCVARWVEVLLVCGCRVAIVEVPVASEQALPVVVTDTESGAFSLALSRSAPARLVCRRPSICPCPHLTVSTVQSPASVALFSPGAVCPAVFYVSRLILVAFVPF